MVAAADDSPGGPVPNLLKDMPATLPKTGICPATRFGRVISNKLLRGDNSPTKSSNWLALWAISAPLSTAQMAQEEKAAQLDEQACGESLDAAQEDEAPQEEDEESDGGALDLDRWMAEAEAEAKADAVQRGGKQTKSTISMKRGAAKCRSVSPSPTLTPLPKEEVLTSIDSLWVDVVTNKFGYVKRGIETGDLLDFWEKCFSSGLRPNLAILTPRKEHIGGGQNLVEPRELSRKDLTRLCALLVDPVGSGVGIATEAVPANMSGERLCKQLKLEATVSMEAEIGLKGFCKLISWVALLMGIDESLIVCHMIWLKQDRFEMTDKMTEVLSDRLLSGQKGRRQPVGGDRTRVGRNEFNHVGHFCGLVDNSGRIGIPWPVLTALFSGMLQHKQDLRVTRHCQKTGQDPSTVKVPRKGKVPDSISGRTEWSILMEALFAMMPDAGGFISPIQMCADLCFRATPLARSTTTATADECEPDIETEPDFAKATSSSDVGSRMPGKSDEATKIKGRFRDLDKDRNGVLDFDEFSALLCSGNTSFSKRELQKLFTLADTNKDKCVVFEEFVDFIFSAGPSVSTAVASFGGRGGAPKTQGVPEGVRNAFRAYSAGGLANMDCTGFVKLMRECNLIDKKLLATDLNSVFSKVKTRNSDRTINMAQFEQALGLVAEKRGCSAEDVYQAVCSLSAAGPSVTERGASTRNTSPQPSAANGRQGKKS